MEAMTKETPLKKAVRDATLNQIAGDKQLRERMLSEVIINQPQLGDILLQDSPTSLLKMESMEAMIKEIQLMKAVLDAISSQTAGDRLPKERMWLEEIINQLQSEGTLLLDSLTSLPKKRMSGSEIVTLSQTASIEKPRGKELSGVTTIQLQSETILLQD